MLTLPIGMLLFVGALLMSTPMASWPTYLNAHSMLIVVGGTIAILALSTPLAAMKQLMRSMLELWERETDLTDYAEDFRELSEARRISRSSTHPLISYAVEMWDNGTGAEVFTVLLSQRKEHLDAQRIEAVQSLKNLAKYPPALGMTGTVMGLVLLFTNLGADAKSTLGPALGLAMTATFFGLLLANGLIMPLADRLSIQHMRWKNKSQSVYELLLLVNRREPATLVQGEVKDRVAAA
ncbi:MAG: MotA/TolQ/ExbB proton channel family protein [Bdellovibrionota bacterium]